MFVVTADQRRSRRTRDRVPEALYRLGALNPAPALAFERTVGDELQGALLDAAQVLAAVTVLIRLDDWSIGVGVGPVELPIPGSTRELRGPAPVAAREAVEHARRRNAPRVSVRAAGSPDSPVHAARTDVETVLRLYAVMLAGRSPHAWEAVDSAAEGSTHASTAARLGVSRQAVGQRLQGAWFDVDEGVKPVIIRMLAQLDSLVSS